jgi:hypothetical protein
VDIDLLIGLELGRNREDLGQVAARDGRDGHGGNLVARSLHVRS